MSGYQVSPFGNASQNALFDPLMARRQTQYDTNDLLSQQAIGAQDTEMVGRLAQSLLAMPEEEAAKAYGPGIAYLQQQGFAKRAPPTYPGHAVAQRLAALTVPAEKQYERGLAGQDAAGFGTRWGATVAPAGRGSPGQSTSYAGGIAGFEGGGAADPGDNPLWPSARGGPAGGHGFIASTWQSFAAANPELFKGMTPQQVMDARKDPALSERATNWYAGENAKVLQAAGIEPTPANLGISHALGPGGARKVLSAADNTPLSQVIPETIAQNPQYGRMTVGDLKQKYARLGPVGGAPATQTAAAAPGAPAGGGVTPAPYQVASVGSTPPPPTQASPSQVAAQQAQATGKPVEIPGGNGSWALPNGNITRQLPPAATTQQPPPPPAAPQVTIPPPPALLGNGLTREQNAEIPALQEAVRRGQMKAPEADAKLLTYQKENVAAQRQYQLDVQAQQDRQQAASDRAEQLRLSQESGQRAADDAAQKAKDAALPFHGNAADVQNRNILIEGTKSGKVGTVEYASAYSDYATEKKDAEGRVFKPDMSVYATPTHAAYGGGKGGREYGKSDVSQAAIAPATMNTAMLGNQAALRNIDNALKELNAHPDSVGLKAVQPDWLLQRTDPEGVTLRADIADILSQTFHDRSGANVTVSESPRLKPFVPDPKDTAAALRTKLERMRTVVSGLLSDHYEIYGPKGGFRAIPGVEDALKAGAAKPTQIDYDATGKVISK